MSKYRKILLTLILAASVAEAEQGEDIINEIPNVTNVVKIKLGDLFLAESETGERLIVSRDGRFAIIGDFKVVDVWRKKEVKTLKQAKDMNLVPVQIFKQQFKESALFEYGDGTKEADIFLDPNGIYNKDAFAAMDVMKNYKFRVHYYAALGKGSNDESLYLLCEPNISIAKEALRTQDFSKLRNKTDCSNRGLHMNDALARTLDIKKVPMLLTPSGRKVYAPTPKNITRYLNDDM